MPKEQQQQSRCLRVVRSSICGRGGGEEKKQDNANACGARKIRERLLHKLGVVDSERIATNRDIGQGKKSGTTTSKKATLTEPLKYCASDETTSTTDCSSSSSYSSSSVFASSLDSNSSLSSFFAQNQDEENSVVVPETRGQRKQLSFNDVVSVKLIPKRTEYSRRIKSRMYTSPEELYQNATRNTVEFAYENWDWRQVVTEDDGMIVCRQTGERIHPVHCAQQQFYHSRSSTRSPLVEHSRRAAMEWTWHDGMYH